MAWGSESDIRKRVREHFSAGADQVCVQVLTDGTAEGIRERWRYLAPVMLGWDCARSPAACTSSR